MVDVVEETGEGLEARGVAGGGALGGDGEEKSKFAGDCDGALGAGAGAGAGEEGGKAACWGACGEKGLIMPRFSSPVSRGGGRLGPSPDRVTRA